MTNIELIDSTSSQSTKITRLYQYLELFSEDEPPRHTLFIMGESSPIVLEALPLAASQSAPLNQLLLIDPPEDVQSRFRLDGNVAVLFTSEPVDVGLPVMQTQPGGVAHIRIGAHFVDIYAHRSGNIIALPALGILCGGSFASDVTLPQLTPASDGSAELDTLRLLARLVKQRRLQLYLPRNGTICEDGVELMRRLAADVAYVHGLRRVLPALVPRHDGLEVALEMADSLLPEERRSGAARQRHQANVQNMLLKR